MASRQLYEGWAEQAIGQAMAFRLVKEEDRVHLRVVSREKRQNTETVQNDKVVTVDYDFCRKQVDRMSSSLP